MPLSCIVVQPIRQGDPPDDSFCCFVRWLFFLRLLEGPKRGCAVGMWLEYVCMPQLALSKLATQM